MAFTAQLALVDTLHTRKATAEHRASRGRSQKKRRRISGVKNTTGKGRENQERAGRTERNSTHDKERPSHTATRRTGHARKRGRADLPARQPEGERPGAAQGDGGTSHGARVPQRGDGSDEQETRRELRVAQVGNGKPQSESAAD